MRTQLARLLSALLDLASIFIAPSFNPLPAHVFAYRGSGRFESEEDYRGSGRVVA